MKRIIFAICSIALAVILPGCATIVSKTSYPVTFTSGDQKLMVRIKKGPIVLAEQQTPFQYTLNAGEGYFDPANYRIEYINPSTGKLDSKPLDASFDWWYCGNIFFSIYGFLIVDPLTGAMWKLPEYVEIYVPAANQKSVAAALNE